MLADRPIKTPDVALGGTREFNAPALDVPPPQAEQLALTQPGHRRRETQRAVHARQVIVQDRVGRRSIQVGRSRGRASQAVADFFPFQALDVSQCPSLCRSDKRRRRVAADGRGRSLEKRVQFSPVHETDLAVVVLGRCGLVDGCGRS
jgi:hypothetical protein